MKSDILVSLIKEVVKNEVKNQVKEELAKLVKSGAVTLNSQKKKTTPTLSEMTAPVAKKQSVSKPTKQITNNPILNEILNQTTPFTAQQRAEGGMPGVGGGSILDAVMPTTTMEDDWETMDFRQTNVPQAQSQPQVDGVSDEYMDALTNALTRDYRELVKRF